LRVPRDVATFTDFLRNRREPHSMQRVRRSAVAARRPFRGDEDVEDVDAFLADDRAFGVDERAFEVAALDDIEFLAGD